MTGPNGRRWHVAVLIAFVAVGLARGAFWVLALEVTSPIDEVQHLAYVASVAEDGTPPVVGSETVPREHLEIVASSRTWPVRQVPVEFTTDDPAWGAVVASYEGVQPPLYYATLAPVYLAADIAGVGPLAVLFVLRGVTVVVALTAVPLLYLLARELFPRHPVAWLAAPGLLVLVQGFNANLAQVNNDAMVVPVSILALLPVARAIRRGPTWWQAGALGVLLAAAQLTKATTIGLGVLAAAGGVIAVVRHRPGLRRVVGLAMVAAGTAAVLVAPWLWWNLSTYGAISAASQVEGITGPLQPAIPMSLRGLVTQAAGAASAFWELQLTFLDPWHPYPLSWYLAVAAGVGAAVALAVRSRRSVTPMLVVWGALSLPVAFITMLAVIYLATGGAGAGLGRHLYLALGPTLLAIAGGTATVLPRRVAVAGFAVLAATVLWFEVGPTHRYLTVYTAGVEGGAVPVVDQTANDEWVAGATIRVDPPCPAVALRLIVDDEDPPPSLSSSTGSLHLTAVDPHPVGWTSARYELDGPTRSSTEIAIPADTAVGSVPGDRSDTLSFAGRAGDPAVSILCEVEDPQDARFSQIYGQMHPDGITRDALRAWPVLWAWTGTAVALVAVAFACVSAVRSRRRGPEVPRSGARPDPPGDAGRGGREQRGEGPPS